MIPLCSPEDARQPTALALGSFDGLHAGHRAVISQAVEDRPPLTVPTVVSFWPHPREVLFSEPRLRLDLPEEKLSLLEPLGIEQLVLVPFTTELARLSAEEFAESVLLDALQAQRIAVGTNFRFGHQRAGDAALLQRVAAAKDVDVRVVDIVKDAEGRMSSSRIRQALEEGDLETTRLMLARPYRFSGLVVRGRGLGKTLGWPTANLRVDGRKALPGLGVYAAWAQLDGDGEKLAAVMNLGPQPTVDPNSASAVEVHLLDRNIELEGRNLTVEPLKRLRGQRKFNGLEELSNQISRDADQGRKILREAIQAAAG